MRSSLFAAKHQDANHMMMVSMNSSHLTHAKDAASGNPFYNVTFVCVGDVKKSIAFCLSVCG